MSLSHDAVTALIALPNKAWKQITCDMRWYYAKKNGGLRPRMPAAIALALNGARLHEDDWSKLRTYVTTMRQRRRVETERERITRKRDNKREYMREYMRARRQAEKETAP